MSVAILSDIHGNLEALERCIEVARRRGATSWLCLGDIVGYGADPSACLDRVRQLTDATVRGNHDGAVAGLQDVAYFNSQARQVARWTTALLSDEECAYLAALPLTLAREGGYFVHADPRDPERWAYVETASAAAAAVEVVSTRTCFVGHSHRPFIAAVPASPQSDRPGGRGARILASEAGPCRLDVDHRYLVNAGSVGQPRDGDPRACFALWEDEENTVELVRVEYDVAAAQDKIRAAGLPAVLAERLALGY